jgi:hypothetical protein
LVPDWDTQTEEIRQELTTAYTLLINGYGQQLNGLNAGEAAQARVELLRQAVLWVRLGLFPDRVEGLRQNQCLGAKSRRRRSCFNAAVSSTDDEHVVGFRMNEHAQFLEGQFVV